VSTGCRDSNHEVAHLKVEINVSGIGVHINVELRSISRSFRESLDRVWGEIETFKQRPDLRERYKELGFEYDRVQILQGFRKSSVHEGRDRLPGPPVSDEDSKASGMLKRALGISSADFSLEDRFDATRPAIIVGGPIPRDDIFVDFYTSSNPLRVNAPFRHDLWEAPLDRAVGGDGLERTVRKYSVVGEGEFPQTRLTDASGSGLAHGMILYYDRPTLPRMRVLNVSGSSGFGTWGAARVASDPIRMKAIVKEAKEAKDLHSHVPPVQGDGYVPPFQAIVSVPISHWKPNERALRVEAVKVF